MMKNGLRLLIGIRSFRLLTFVLCGDTWSPPEPVSFHSKMWNWVAEMFPSQSRRNPGDKGLCYFYQVTSSTYGDHPPYEVDAKLQWKAELVNQLMPMSAVVSNDGYLVTLNEFGRLGYENTVLLYDTFVHMINSS